jgi:hypothetical protein
MQYLANLDKQSWETARHCFETRFELTVRSASAEQLARALSELDIGISEKTFIIREMGQRIGRMEDTYAVSAFAPRTEPSDFALIMRVVLHYAGGKEDPDDLEPRLTALDALKTAFQRESYRSDEQIGVVINGLSEAPIIAQRCAEMVETVRLNWPSRDIGSLKARFDDLIVPALERNAERLKSDKCAEGSLLDALEHIRHGTIVGEDKSYRNHLGDEKPLRVPLLAQKLRKASGNLRMTARA